METAAHPRSLFKQRTFGKMFVTLTSSTSLWTGVVKTFRCPNEINPLVADVLTRIADDQTARNRIMTGWFLTSTQLAGVAAHLTSHAPHPDVGGLGRLNSVPVFAIDDFGELNDATQTDVCDGVRFTFVQLDIVN